jgi:hypothetical protein
MARFKRAYPGLPYIQQFAATYAPGTPGAYQVAPVLPRRPAPARAQVGPLAGAAGGGLAIPPDPPVLVTSYPVYQTTVGSASLVTPSFTPAIGELLVIKGIAEDVGMLLSTPTGGGLTYTLRVSQVGVSGNVNAYIWTAPVTASASMTVTVAETGNTGVYSMVVERWSGAQLAATPATVDTRGTGAPSTTLTTVGASSIVSWLNGDWAAVSGASRTYNTTSAVPTEDGYTTTAGNYTAYYAYQIATAPGAQTFGLTAPTGQTWSLLGIEIENAGGGTLPGPAKPAAPGPAWRRQFTHRQQQPYPPVAAAIAPSVTPAPTPPRFRPRPKRRAAVGGTSLCGGGLAVPPPPVIPVTAYQSRPFVARNPAPARARCGPRAAAAAGIPAPVPPLGQPSRPAPRPVIQHLPPHRAKVGPGTYLAAGIAALINLPAPLAGQPQSAAPFIQYRPPPPPRAHVGPRGLAAGGVASAAPALGSPSRPGPRPVIQHLPPRRAVWYGRAVPPPSLGSLPSPAPRPVIRRLPPRRALWRGLAAQNYPAVSLGAVPPAVAPAVARNPIPARARLGSHAASASGRAVPAPPLGVPPSPAPRPVIQHLPPRRRVLWRGLAASPPVTLGTPARPRPFVARNPAPARAHLGPSGATGAGAAGHAITVPTGQPYRRPPIQIRRPAPAPAWTGHGPGSVPPTGAATSYRIWPDTPGPATDSGDPTGYALGVQFTLSQNATFTGIWFWRAAVTDALPTSAAIFQVTGPGAGTLVSGTNVTFGATTDTGWIKAPSSAGVVLIAGVNYKAVAAQSGGGAWYSATAHYFDTGPGAAGITSGIISAPNNAGADGGQDTFNVGGTLAYPASSFNATNYWVDVEVTLIPPQAPGTPGAYQRTPPQIKRPAPNRASVGPRGTAGAGSIGLFNKAVGLPQPTMPRVTPGPPGARARAGHSLVAGGIAYGGPNTVPIPVVTAYQRPAPQIRRATPARARLGRAAATAGGTAVQVTTLGLPQVAVMPVFGQRRVTRAWAGHGPAAGGIAFGAANAAPAVVVTAYQRPPVQVRRPAPARAVLGPRGSVSGGTTAPPAFGSGAPQPAVPDLVFRPPVRQPRVLWHGLTSQAVTIPTGQPYRRPAPYIKRPAPNRAVVGHGGVAGGVASRAVTIPTGQPYQRPAPYIKRPAPNRALIGHGGVAGGIASRAITIPTGQLYQRPAPYIKRPAPARGIAGPRSATWAGRTGVASTLGSLGPPKPFVFRSPLPARARTGPAGQVAGGVAVFRPALGVTGPPKPFVWRSPLHAAARTGPRGAAGGGFGAPHPPTGALGPPKPFVWRPPLPARGRCGPRGQAAAGTAGLYNKAVTAVAVRPFVWRPPLPARSRLGPRGQSAAGYASRVVTQLGAPQYAIPTVPGRRPPPLARAVFGGVLGLVNLKPVIVPGVTGTAAVQDLTGTATPQDLTGAAVPQDLGGGATVA